MKKLHILSQCLIVFIKTSSQKDLGILDEPLSFEKRLKSFSVKTNKTLYLLHKLQNPLPRSALTLIWVGFLGVRFETRSNYARYMRFGM